MGLPAPGGALDEPVVPERLPAHADRPVQRASFPPRGTSHSRRRHARGAAYRAVRMPRLGGWFDPRPPTGALRPVLLTLGGDATAALTPPCGTTSGAQLKWEGWDMGSKLRLATPLLAVVALMLIGATASIAASGNGNGRSEEHTSELQSRQYLV